MCWNNFLICILNDRHVMEALDKQGRKVISGCQELKNKEWEIFITESEDLVMWMRTQERVMVERGKNMTRQDIEELMQSQATNSDMTEQINRKLFEVSALQASLPSILSRCDAEQSRQAKEVMDR